MVDRQEVEALLEGTAEENGRADRHVPPETLAALCRAWLAVQDAQIGEVEEEMHGLVIRAHPLQKGQRVRIVKEAGE